MNIAERFGFWFLISFFFLISWFAGLKHCLLISYSREYKSVHKVRWNHYYLESIYWKLKTFAQVFSPTNCIRLSLRTDLVSCWRMSETKWAINTEHEHFRTEFDWWTKTNMCMPLALLFSIVYGIKNGNNHHPGYSDRSRARNKYMQWN